MLDDGLTVADLVRPNARNRLGDSLCGSQLRRVDPLASRPQGMRLHAGALGGSGTRGRLQNVSTAAVDSCGLGWTAVNDSKERKPL